MSFVTVNVQIILVSRGTMRVSILSYSNGNKWYVEIRWLPGTGICSPCETPSFLDRLTSLDLSVESLKEAWSNASVFNRPWLYFHPYTYFP